MDKNIIKKHLTKKFVNEAKDETSNTPGISVTDAVKKKSAEENKKGVKDIDKGLADYEKSLKKGMETTKVENKFNYSNNEEVEYHRQMEIMNGQEMIQYARDPITEFKDRAKEAIEGSSRMGNNPEWANVIPAQQGFTGPDFGKNLVKSIESSFEKRMDAEKGNYSFGDDIENENRADLKMTRFSALAENNDNNKPQIKETMKRLKFKKEFNGVGNALKMIPESYRVDNKVFEMTDGVENYKIRWEGSLTEGKAVVLMASDKNLVNEDMQKMKHLMGYKSQETLGTVKGKSRLDENAKFNDIWKKTRTLMEMEDIEDADAKEGNWDEINVPQAADAKKHIEGSVSTEKGTKAPKPKSGNWDEVKKKAAEATKHVTMKESVEMEENVETTVKAGGKNIEDVSAEENYWEKKKVPQAAEAKKHVHMGKESKAKLETEGKENEEGLSEGIVLGGIKFEPINESMYEGMYEEGLYEYGDEHPIATKDAVNTMDLDEYGDEHAMATDDAVQSIEVGAEKVADKIESILSPDEVNFLVQAYQQGGKEMVANALNQSVNEGLPEPPAEGDYGMSQSELKLRQILDKVIMRGALSSLAGIIPAAMMGHPGLAVGLGIAALAGTAIKDAAWWKKNGHHYGAQDKYGVK
jgi:hypothetical protein